MLCGQSKIERQFSEFYDSLRPVYPLQCFSVVYRILYENGSVDANRSMRFQRYENTCI